MKRNLVTCCIFVFLALAVVLVIKSKNRLRRAGSANSNPAVIQQDGTLIVRQPQPEAQPVIIATLPSTNAITNRPAR